MRVTVFTVGSRGDVQPFVALSAGLQEAGYNVTVATHENFQQFVEERGLSFAGVGGNPREILESEEGKAWLESDKNPIDFFRGIVRLMKSQFGRLLDDAVRVCEASEAVVYSPLTMSAYHMIEKRGIPGIFCALQPVIATRAFASPVWPPLPLGSLYNVLSHSIAGQMFWQPFRNSTNEWRRKRLGLEKTSFLGPFHEIRKRKAPILMGFSPTIVPAPTDWPESVYVTGYWFLNRKEEWNADPALWNFIQSGPPPVYIGFGSMTDRQPDELTRIVLEAVRRSGVRAILHSGWAGLQANGIPDSVFVVDSVPHDWLFPQMSAVVHHGGAGTTAAALRAGIPAIVIPFFSDQHFWASRVNALGTATRPLPRKQLTAEKLALVLCEVTNRKSYRSRAAEIASQIRNEDGVSKAIEIVDRVFRA